MKSPQALQHLLDGRRLTRAAWPTGTWVVRRTGYPDGIPVNDNTAQSFGVPAGTLVPFRAYYQRHDPHPGQFTIGSVGAWFFTPEDLEADDWNLVTDAPVPLGSVTVTAHGQDGTRTVMTGDAHLKTAEDPFSLARRMNFPQAVDALNAGYWIRREPWEAGQCIGRHGDGEPLTPESFNDDPNVPGSINTYDRLADDWIICPPPRNH